MKRERTGRFDTCSLCPRLCRHACPVASASTREASVPALIGGVLRDWERGQLSDALALEAATLCVDCGACRDSCHLHVPLPEHLRSVRSQLSPPMPIEPLQPVEGQGALLAIEADERPLARILQERLGREVARWRTGDRLGCAAIEPNGRGWDAHGAAIRAQAQARQVVTVDGGVAQALRTAGVAFQWAWELLPQPQPMVGSCASGGERPQACCGGAGPLARHHPRDAERVARRFWEHAPHPRVADARCRAHLRSAGLAAHDWLDHLVREEP